MANPLEVDLRHILQYAAADLETLRNKQLFITGGTGFFGLWLLELIAWANEDQGLNISATILTRNPAAVNTASPRLARNPAFTLLQGDIRHFDFPAGEVDIIIHGATTTARETFNQEDGLKKYETVAEGTRRMLEYACESRPEKILYLGSGAYYGLQPASVEKIEETFTGAPDPTQPNAALGIGKRTAEFFCQYYGTQYNLDISIARCFSFYGPYLPLDIHYAIGNFLADGLAGRPITVAGDGQARRSYLYVADLMIWLLRILVRGKPGEAYNVGSDTEISIADLAGAIGSLFNQSVSIGQPPATGPVSRYIPSTAKAQQELALEAWTSLEDGLLRMADHVKARPDFYQD